MGSSAYAVRAIFARIHLHVPPNRGINVVTAIAAKGKTTQMTISIPQEQTKVPATATVQGAPPAKKAPVAKRRAHVAPSKAQPARKATRAKKPTTARAGSKTAKILDLLKRPGGATLKQLQKATGWQPHSVRGFLSGAVGKKMKTRVESSKTPTASAPIKYPPNNRPTPAPPCLRARRRCFFSTPPFAARWRSTAVGEGPVSV
jgi:hypothetical protein